MDNYNNTLKEMDKHEYAYMVEFQYVSERNDMYKFGKEFIEYIRNNWIRKDIPDYDGNGRGGDILWYNPNFKKKLD